MDLTKNLYFVNDVKWALFDSLKNKNEDKTIFWLVEYYESGYKNETWQIIYVIYSCYYAKHYPNVKKNIDKEYKKWLNNQDVKYILKIVFYIFKLKNKDDEIYKLFMCKMIKKKYIMKKTDKKTIKELESCINAKIGKKYKEFVKNLKEKHIQNIWINILLLDFEKCYKLTKCYFEMSNKKIEDIIYKEVSFPKVQLFLEIYININEIKRRKKLIIVKKEAIKKYNLYNKKCKKTVDILKEKRVFKIPDSIIQFDCLRKKFTKEEMQTMYLDNWLYYCRNTPYWKEIFEKYKITFDTNKEPIFENEKIEDNFYEKYYLDPDEQPIYVKEKSNFKL